MIVDRCDSNSVNFRQPFDQPPMLYNYVILQLCLMHTMIFRQFLWNVPPVCILSNFVEYKRHHNYDRRTKVYLIFIVNRSSTMNFNASIFKEKI